MGPVRDGTILEVRGSDGAPPCLVRWIDNPSPALVYPRLDAQVVQWPAFGLAKH
ncbi:DUF1918 domain-containing protein [Kribbella qitaiheensis]|uniref:DUF1918 domain-containing protein n=1 Tax=Kribbella qitaiheensis TaxID=1544730 RepID=UPI00361BEBBA